MLLDPAWLPSCSMKRVICHWTAGGHKASSLDKEHYHVLVEADGKLVRGRRSIADNVSTTDGVYAAHTKGCNTGSIGIAVCAMSAAVERPFHPGPQPMLEAQWRRLAEVAAELCRAYSIPVTPKTVLGHGEVQVQLGVTQAGKWDPMVLPWDPAMSASQVGTFFRTLVQARIDQGGLEPESPVAVTVLLDGKKIGDARLLNGSCYAPADAVARRIGVPAPAEEASDLLLEDGRGIPIEPVDGEPHVDVIEVATALGLKPRWNSTERVLTLR
jgi:hypothetical protein